jgi:hypothetical protein
LSFDAVILFKNASKDCNDKSERASLSMKKSVLASWRDAIHQSVGLGNIHQERVAGET